MKSLVTLFLAMSISMATSAQPWVDASDTRLRQHLAMLNDAGHINISLSTWPLMWAEVDRALASVDVAELNAAERYAWRELRFEKKKQADKGGKRSIGFGVTNSPSPIRHADKRSYYKAEVVKRMQWDGDAWALGLQGNAFRDEDGDFESHLDGSYVARAVGDWAVGLGAIDRWWGPSESHSLILSNNARPVPAFFLRTKSSQSFESAWLSWLGNWDFTMFVGQLESSRVVPEAKLTGMRFVFRPLHGLEIGLSRAMQWGGKGRDDGIDAFFKSLTSQDENTEDGAGNQLGGFDARYGWPVRQGFSSALYFQMIGEDEAGFMPSKYTAQFGVEGRWALAERADSIHLSLEWLDSTAGVLGAEHPDTAYEHSAYRTGYRYRGLPMGASVDNDSRALSVRAVWVMPNRKSLQLRVDRWQLNRVGSGGRHSLTVSPQSLWHAGVAYEFVWSNVRWRLAGDAYSKGVESLSGDFDRFAANVELEYRY